MPWLHGASIEPPPADASAICLECEDADCEGCAETACTQCDVGALAAADSPEHDNGDDELDDYEPELDWQPPTGHEHEGSSGDQGIGQQRAPR